MSTKEYREHMKRLISHDESREFVGDDGLIHCMVCGKPKQFLPWHEVRAKSGGALRWGWFEPWPCVCDCQKEDRDLVKAVEAEIGRLSREIRKECFGDSRFKDATFGKSRFDGEAATYCKRYAENFAEIAPEGAGLLLYGAVGTGKTHLAACIANEVARIGAEPKFTRIAEISDEIAGNFGKVTPTLDRLKRFDLIIIDDLGTERTDERTETRAFQAIDMLYSEKIPFIVTTNLPLSAFQTGGDGIASRMYSRILGQCVPVEVKGHDRRGDDSKERLDRVRSIMKGMEI